MYSSRLSRAGTITLSLLLSSAMAMMAGSCELVGGETITGSGTLATESYDLADFTELEIGSAFDVEVTRGDDFAVEVTVDDNVVDKLDVKRDGKKLRIAMQGPHTYVSTTQGARVTMPGLDRLDISGASSVTAGEGFVSDGALDVQLSGSSRLDGSGFQADEATLDISGASKVAMTGSARSADIKLSGASGADLGGFTVGDVEVNMSGSSDAVVNASGTITADLSGSSKLTYLGEPTLGELKTSGGSTVERG
jgi:hypothetical protein